MLHYIAIFLSRIFFKMIRISGTPVTGKSTIWIVNHSNGIVDPMVMLAFAPAQSRPLAKATLWKNVVMRQFLKWTNAIPVARPQDVEEMFQNKAVDPDWIKTVNAQAFASVQTALSEGDHVLIFPEGISHDDPFMHPLKKGVARMWLTGKEHGTDATIQSVIIDYTEKNEFRSNLYIEFCDPIKISENETVESLMKKIQNAFDLSYLRFDSWLEKRNWQYIFNLYYKRVPLSYREFKDFVEANRTHIEEDKVLIGKIQMMRIMSQSSFIASCDKCWQNAMAGKENPWWFFMFLLSLLSVIFITFPVLALNALIWGFPLELCKKLGGQKKYNRDVYATLTIANAMWVFPVWSLSVTGMLAFIMVEYIPQIHILIHLFFFLLFLPILLWIGVFISENFKKYIGYMQYGYLKLTFPRALQEMIMEWRNISDAVIQKVKK